MVGFFHGKTIYQRMRTGGAPILGNLHICLKNIEKPPFYGDGNLKFYGIQATNDLFQG